MATAQFNLLDVDIFTFDVWNTLIVANPEFSRLRTEEIAKFYGISFADAKEAYTAVKHFLDQSAEIASICMNTPQCWQLLDATINRLRRNSGLIEVDVGIEMLASNCNNLFRKNLPVFTEDTKDVLRKLKARGKVLGIISNTNFIPGGLLWEELFMDLEVFVDPYFSDEHLAPKPHKFAFQSVLAAATESYYLTPNHKDVNAPKVVHVGDNLICDGGATRVRGYGFQHVVNPTNLVEIFKEMGI